MVQHGVQDRLLQEQREEFSRRGETGREKRVLSPRRKPKHVGLLAYACILSLREAKKLEVISGY